MPALRQGFCHWCFAGRGVAPDELFRAARSIGYEAVDLADEALWPMIVDAGLSLGAMGGHADIASGFNRRENFPRLEAELHAALARAVAWKIPVLICFSGNRRGLDDAVGLEHCAEGLSRIAPAAEAAGVILAVELLNSRIDHPDYQGDRTSWGVRLCELVGSPAVRLLYDIYHMHVMEGEVVPTLRRWHPYFAHYHTAGYPGRGEPGDGQDIDYPEVYRTLAEIAPGAWVTHEFLPAGHPVEALERAFRQVQRALGD